MALNHIVLQGRLTKDVELRHTQSEKAVASVSIAVDRGGKDKGTDFINLVAWTTTAEFLSRYFSKGDMILVEGRLTSRNYEDKSGNKRTAFEVVVGNVNFCGSKGNGEKKPTGDVVFEEIEGDEDSLPF